MSLKCNLCNIEFKNDDQFSQHLNGRKHKKFESVKEEREKSARRSLFVSNLIKRRDDDDDNKATMFVKHIEEHFGRYGTVVKVFVDTANKHSYAIVEYADEASVDKALACARDEHKINGKLVKVSRRELKEFVARTGSSAAANENTDERKENMDKLKREAIEVNTILGKCESFEDQIEKLIAYFKVGQDEIDRRESICVKLSQIFKQFWPETEFHMSTFGSSKNGLACQNSDVDLTLLLTSYLAENQHRQQVLPKIVAKQLKSTTSHSNSSSTTTTTTCDEDIDAEHDERHIEDVNEHQETSVDSNLKECVVRFFNNKEYGQLIKFDVEIQVKIIARIIQRFAHDIKSLKTITNARCPVVRFYDDKINIHCDLSMNNYLACQNTKLICLYMQLEPNLEKLIFVLRYWFKHKNLYGMSKFNSYLIIFLIVFYMQARRIGYLPTAEYLASLTG